MNAKPSKTLREVRQDGPQDSPHDVLDGLTVRQAADRLGITQDAVRKRIARGTIGHDKDHKGRIFVYLDPFERKSKTDQDNGQDGESKTVPDDQDRYTRSLEDQIDFLRRELERKDTIIMSLTQRIPELEAAPEPREAPQTASEEPYSTHAPPEAYGPPEPPQERKRSWWREFFGLE
jgi:hypothetical protein